MPHINRIRVNNIKYNVGTQFYDDPLVAIRVSKGKKPSLYGIVGKMEGKDVF